MRKSDRVAQFRNDEDGAATIDWVVLSAAVMGMGLAIVSTVNDATQSSTDGVMTAMGNAVTAGLQN
ncbi:MAG: pilus assembly protein [Rhodobacterales bacterium]|nr:pilus assembly protein [Rhodobacterales bacterium]